MPVIGSAFPRWPFRIMWLLCWHAVATRAVAQPVVITEIMYRPFAGQVEWIEIANIGAGPVDLAGWRLGDLARPEGRRITATAEMLLPGAYAVVAPDRASVVFLNPSAIVLEMATGFPGLNNDGDAVILRDGAGVRADSVRYDAAWGGDVGVSLERIRAAGPSNDRANWNSSTDPRGATPGERNALDVEGGAGAAEWTADPNPFSPDGDGFEDETLLHYTLPFLTGRMTIEVYDVVGRRVRRLSNNVLTPARGTVAWDGRDDRGRRLPLGTYIALLRAIDDVGGHSVQRKMVVVIAERL